MIIADAYTRGPVWPADWSQFIPDALGAILTGAIIGLVLWRVESGASTRRARSEAEARWRVKRAGLGATMPEHLNRLYPNEPAMFYPLQWETFFSALDPQIAVWAEDSPRNRELNLARSMLVDLPLLKRLGNELRLTFAVELVSAGPVQFGNESGVSDYCMVRVMVDQASALYFFDEKFAAAGKPESHEDWKSMYDAVLEQEELRADIAAFQAVQGRVERNWAMLREMLLVE